MNRRPLCVGFSASGQPLAAYEGGCFVLLRPGALGPGNCPLGSRTSLRTPRSTALLPRRAHAQLLTQLMHSPPPDSGEAAAGAGFVHPRVAEWLPRGAQQRLAVPMPRALRCAAISLELGLSSRWRFWSLVAWRLALPEEEVGEAAGDEEEDGRGPGERAGVPEASGMREPPAFRDRSIAQGEIVGPSTAAAVTATASETASVVTAAATVGGGGELWATFGVLRSAVAVRADRLARLAEQMAAAAAGGGGDSGGLSTARRAAHQLIGAGSYAGGSDLLLGHSGAEESDWLLGVVAAGSPPLRLRSVSRAAPSNHKRCCNTRRRGLERGGRRSGAPCGGSDARGGKADGGRRVTVCRRPRRRRR